jgi:hypothetical protein
MSGWSQAFAISLASNETQQIVGGTALVIVRNMGPGNLSVGTSGITVKPDRVVACRENDLTLHASGGSCTVAIYYAAL